MPAKIILFTSTSGIRQNAVLKRLRSYIVRKVLRDESVTDLAGERLLAREREIIPIYEIPRISVAVLDGEVREIHEEAEAKLQRAREIIDEFRNSEECKYIFLRTHASYYVRGQFTSWILADSSNFLAYLKDLQIEKVINLNDNIYNIREVINSRDDYYKYKLKELLVWRDIELFAADFIARQVLPEKAEYRRSYWLSINHPLSMVADLVCESTRTRIYMAYSISKIRELQAEGKEDQANELLDQNISFRKFMTERFVAFDPTTIDERPIQIRYLDGLKEIAKFEENEAHSSEACTAKRVEIIAKGVVIDRSISWPSISDELLSESLFPEFRIPFDEVEEIASKNIEEAISDLRKEIRGEKSASDENAPKEKSLIDRHINSRDFRLIDQCNALIAYRPTIDGQLSGGVAAELQYVSEIHTKTSRVVIKLGDPPPIRELFSEKKPFDKEMFGKNISEYENLEDEESRKSAFDEVAGTVEESLNTISKERVID